MIELRRIVHAARVALGMDVAFVGQFLDERRVFRHVDVAPACDTTVGEGQAGRLEDTYCKMIVDGALPNVIPVTRRHPVASAMPITADLRIGAHVGVPVRLSDGTVFGTFCCFAEQARPSLDGKDLAALQAFADLAATGIEHDLRSEQSSVRKERRVRGVIETFGPAMVFQPVFMLDGLRPVGAEALARFPGHADIPIDVWFKDAAELGLQVEFELSAVARALALYAPIWARHKVQLGLNVSPATMQDKRLWDLLEDAPRELVVLELTEHEEVRDYPALLEATTRLRERGTKIAIDDVGAGYASMRHVLKLRPDILKLDLALTRSIDTDDLKLALASSLKFFADRFDCRIVAEGVESPAELATLQGLGLQAVQGYLLGRPVSADDLLALFDRACGPAARSASPSSPEAGRPRRPRSARKPAGRGQAGLLAV